MATSEPEVEIPGFEYELSRFVYHQISDIVPNKSPIL